MRSIHSMASLFLGIFLLLVVSARGEAEGKKTDLQHIKTQLVERLCNPLPGTANPADKAQQWLGTLKEDGTWSDINYADETRGDWSPAKHLKRVQAMALAYSCPENPSHGNPALLTAIHSALGHWLAKDYQCPNWWYNIICVPGDMASVLLLMENKLSPQEKENALKIVERAAICKERTGQNLVWVAGTTLIRGLLQADPVVVQSARDAILSEIVVREGEGLQADQSYHLHGRQLQQGNYGLGFAGDCAEWAQLFRGTGFALDESKLNILRSYLLEGQRYMFWKGAMDISACGRQLFPGAPVAKCLDYVKVLKTMQQVDPAYASQYQAAIDSSLGNAENGNTFIANKHFWRSDFMVDRRSGYYASVKMSSQRVIGSEICNGENLKGIHLGDGALYLYQRGDEYKDIFPVWDWRRLPGTTTGYDSAPLQPKNHRVDSDFVGGVSDGRDGAATLDYRCDGIVAKKSWFFFEGRIVCLGAGIQCDKEKVPLVTEVNQCLQQGDIIVGQENTLPMTVTDPKDPKGYPGLEWAWHDGVGYVFPTPQKVTLGDAKREGSWKKNVYETGRDTPVSKEVFEIYLYHGCKPKHADYSYVILPLVTPEQVQAFVKTPDVEWLSNTVDIQAVKSRGLAMAVFYQPGELVYAPGQQIEVKQPCLVMVRETAHGPKLTVADPTEKLSSIDIVLNGKSTTIQLPQGSDAGRSVEGQ
jgi:chondroitin AC lyase